MTFHAAAIIDDDLISSLRPKAPDEFFDDEETKSVLRNALLAQPARTERILRLRYWENVPVVEIAEQLGLCRDRIYQIELTAMRRLRRDVNAAFNVETTAQKRRYWPPPFYKSDLFPPVRSEPLRPTKTPATRLPPHRYYEFATSNADDQSREAREASAISEMLPSSGAGVIEPCPLCRQGRMSWGWKDGPPRCEITCSHDECFNMTIGRTRKMAA